ncbi:peptidylprolyl isomerase [Hyphomicrobium methylovorum]|uniref:SurA N-terminal domain-containing protein n=1 Tax=Hyphomicrobium methylovorum TaxID=84 RepID=UPI0015E70409|nr:SurA N-terminal domain-containing protein [Hyphomicrobium methylovorum]MBA2127690.1 peptidylprolyl isomerase [Hyphomicrobium methylovorum]
MLEALRRGAQTPLAKVLFGILCFSFAIWGVADVFHGWGTGSVAKIGSTSITTEEFRQSYQQELDRVSRQANQRLTAEQGRAFGLDRRVVAQLVAGSAIEQNAEQLGLSLSDKTLVDGIQSDPNFQTDGKFNRLGFENMLRQMGMSEQHFLKLRRQDELRGMIVESFLAAQTVPKPLFDAIHAHNQEKRVLEWLKIDPEAVTVKEPDQADLQKRYDDNKTKYETPEYRKVQLLMLTLDDLKKQVEVSDDEITKAYEASKSTYDQPEKRRVQQIAFKDTATAEAALKALRDGTKSFADVAKDAGAKDTDVDLGLVTKSALIDPKIADVAFSIEKDKYSDVVEGRFATVIVRVTQIEPGVTHTLADVKEKVREKLAADKASTGLQNRRDDVEDNRLAGKTLQEVADQLKLTFKEIPAVDATGLAPDGKPVLLSPDLQKIIARVFAPESNNDDTAIDLTDGGAAWVNVLSTEEPKLKPFDTVKDQVKEDYMKAESQRLIGEMAKKITERVNAGEPLSAFEAEAKNKVEKTDPITRNTVPQSISQSMMEQAFATAKGKAGHGPSSDRSTDIVFRVAEVIPAAEATLTEKDELNRRLEAELANQSLTEYTEGLKKRYGASINQAELNSAIGLGGE